MSEISARAQALELLVRTDVSGVYTNLALDAALKKNKRLSEQDRRFVTALYYGVTERRLTLDIIIKKYSSRQDKQSARLKNILRLGLYQLLYMDSVPDSAAVNESVKLAGELKNPALKGYVNALLRAFLRDDKKIPKTGNMLKDLTAEYSMPHWIIEQWLSDYGDDITKKLLENSLGKAPVTVRLNTAKFSESEIISELFSEHAELSPTGFDISACYNLKNCGPVEELSAYKKGMFHVQDISCQICCHELGAKHGETVLDLCSAPGVKAFTIAELADDAACIYAYDLHKNRVRLIQSGAERLGLKSITAAENNAKIYSENIPMADRVLCDVPCSGLGVIRRKPEIKYRPKEEIKALPEVQYAILETSSRYVRPGGILMYSTCTLRHEENGDIVKKFLQLHPDFAPEELENFSGHEATLTPDKIPGDGFYIAKMRRKA